MFNTREIATRILNDVYEKCDLETATNINKNFNKLDKRDKAFVRLIVLNTLRRNGQIDRVISDLVKRPFKRKDSYILNLIRISICQILFLDVAEYSTVNSAVEISKNHNRDKFVNALLRNVCRKKKNLNKSSTLEHNVPKWIKTDVINFLGKEVLAKISKSIVSEPALDIKIKKKYSKRKNWEKLLNGKFIDKELLRIPNDGPINLKPFFNEGMWWIQGISSTLPVLFIDSVFEGINPSSLKILDVGSSPGGKTFQLLEKGFDVTPIEISKRRIQKLKENLSRLNLNASIVSEDFLKYKTKKFFDCVLVDAPCTASGLIQKKPEILIRDKGADLDRLVEKQKLMLEKSSRLTKKGGYILYCVCSIHTREGIRQIENFLVRNKDFSLVTLNKSIGRFGKSIANGMLLITPDSENIKGGLDGFFISLLRKG
ncbi:MAG: transcription antitermination factor NusB [Pseudomonadota bacterium]|nr:transcription antitermination factor NusB [Pseudomonadota bacterium]